jgi:hypothetical protein
MLLLAKVDEEDDELYAVEGKSSKHRRWAAGQAISRLMEFPVIANEACLTWD